MKGLLNTMSIWTHVDGHLNFNNSVSALHISNFLGPQSIPGSYRYKDTRLPIGSEGSIRYAVQSHPYISVGDVEIEGVTVGILGNLRDYDNLDSIKTWINSMPESFVSAMFVRDDPKDEDYQSDEEIFSMFVRSAIITATCGKLTKTWMWDLDASVWKEI